MKPLAAALVICTLIVTGAVYGLPYLTRQRELAIMERKQAQAERSIEATILFVAPEQPEPKRRGLRAAREATAP